MARRPPNRHTFDNKPPLQWKTRASPPRVGVGQGVKKKCPGLHPTPKGQLSHSSALHRKIWSILTFFLTKMLNMAIWTIVGRFWDDQFSALTPCWAKIFGQTSEQVSSDWGRVVVGHGGGVVNVVGEHDTEKKLTGLCSVAQRESTGAAQGGMTWRGGFTIFTAPKRSLFPPTKPSTEPLLENKR